VQSRGLRGVAIDPGGGWVRLRIFAKDFEALGRLEVGIHGKANAFAQHGRGGRVYSASKKARSIAKPPAPPTNPICILFIV
jgi:hypothetical protein